MRKKEIANCIFAFKCPQVWQNLAATESESIRRCNVCEREVYLAEDEEAFGMLAAIGRCVAIPTAEPSEPLDYEEDYLLGIPADTTSLQSWPIFLECAHENLRGNAPGCLLNSDEPGSDGNYYSIERNADKPQRWDLFKCVPEYFFAAGFKVSPVAVGITVEELYDKIESVGIFIQGHEAIALGLPFHGDNQ